jgi:hypothetical protein
MKNISVLVSEHDMLGQCIPDSIANDRKKAAKADSVLNQIQIFMGLPVIKMLNHVQFDLQKNEMSISLNRKNTGDKESNLYIDNCLLYVNTKINQADFTAFFDTGGGFDSTVIYRWDF